jgi:hypothetical protein
MEGTVDWLMQMEWVLNQRRPPSENRHRTSVPFAGRRCICRVSLVMGKAALEKGSSSAVSPRSRPVLAQSGYSPRRPKKSGLAGVDGGGRDGFWEGHSTRPDSQLLRRRSKSPPFHFRITGHTLSRCSTTTVNLNLINQALRQVKSPRSLPKYY